MLNSVACKSSSKGTFWTKQLIMTIVVCSMLRVKRVDFDAIVTNPLTLIKDRTTYEQPLPINLSILTFDISLTHAPTNLKSFICDYAKNKDIFDLKQRHVSTVESLNNSNKNFFSNNYIVDIFVFTSSIISLISTTLIIYLYCKHKHIRTLVASLILHKIEEVEASPISKEANSECKTLSYIGIILTVLSLTIITFLHYRKSRFCKGYKFSNAVKIMLFISDIQSYVPIKLCKTAGSIHLFKIKGMLNTWNIKLNKTYLWDTLEINWKEVTVTFNDKKIELPIIIAIRIWDKIKVRRLMSRESLIFHIMIRQGITWFNLETELPEIV